MNIVYLIHQFYPECWTGTEKFVLRVSSMIQKAGHRASVITYSIQRGAHFNKAVGDILYKEFTYEGIRVIALRHKHPTKYLNIGLGDNSMTDIAKYLLSTEKPDIIHIGHPMRVNELAIVAKSLNIPYIITLTDFWMLCPKGILIDTDGKLCIGPNGGRACIQSCPELSSSNFITPRLIATKDILFEAKKVITPSNFLGSIFKKEFNELNIEVINYGLSRNMRKKEKVYKKGDGIVFCYAGSLNPHKGVHLLLEAFREIKAQNITLKIFGSSQNQGYINKLLDMARNDSKIEFCGVFPEREIGNLLSDIDVVVVPSLWHENRPLIMIEALSCHTPVVISNVGGMTETVKSGINGFIFQRGDRNDLRDTLKRIVNNPVILNNIRKNIKRDLLPTTEQEAYAYYKLYNEILKNR